MTTREQYIARDVLLGKRHWSDLRNAGVEVRTTRGGWIFVPSTMPPLSLSPEELAHGIVRQLETEDGGREWASVVLAAADLVDLDDTADGDANDRALDALWELSFGNRARAAALVDCPA